jgi:hypothetical protein
LHFEPAVGESVVTCQSGIAGNIGNQTASDMHHFYCLEHKGLTLLPKPAMTPLIDAATNEASQPRVSANDILHVDNSLPAQY